jgi:hypothetical protein
MESDRALIAALIFILLIIGANFVVYAIARGAAKGAGSRWMSALRDSLSKPLEGSSDKSMDELRKRMEELEKNKQADESSPPSIQG